MISDAEFRFLFAFALLLEGIGSVGLMIVIAQLTRRIKKLEANGG